MKLKYYEVEVTPEMAKDWLDKNNQKTNRKIDRRQVEKYKRELKSGNWMLNGDAIRFYVSGSLSDGQHRLTAIYETGITTLCSIIENIPDEAKSTIDVGKSRKNNDVFTLSNVKFGNKMIAAINKYLEINSNTKKSDLTATNLLTEYQLNQSVWDDSINFSIKYYHLNKILSPAEISAYYVYLHIDKNHDLIYVEDFLKELLGEISPVTNNSILVLQERLKLKTKNLPVNVKSSIRYNLIAKTWNAYMNNQVLTYINWLAKQPKIEMV